MIQGPIQGQATTDPEIIWIRRGWQAGMTLSQSFRRAASRVGMTDTGKAINEWRKMKRLFGCGSARIDYVNGWHYRAPQPPTEAELNAIVGPAIYGGSKRGLTYGEWAGITGPGKRLREIIANN